MNPDHRRSRVVLDAALDALATTFRGMIARPDEHNCPCHWGSAQDLAQLKVPDVELPPDLLRRTWQAADWTDYASVLRRILPQFTKALVNGLIEPLSPFGMESAGRCFARGRWQDWPTAQATAVREFLHAWWNHTLTDSEPAVPGHQVLALAAEASATLNPWLATWETLTHPVATQHLAEAVAYWEHDLLADQLPWDAWENEEQTRTELTAWLVRHAPGRLRAHGVSDELLNPIRLIGLTGSACWQDPHSSG